MKKRTRSLKRETVISSPADRVFDFFSRAENLNRITPPWLHFKILTKFPIKMQKGTRIDYSLKLHGVPIRWKSQITEWNPPYSFVDTQIKGPYIVWIHRHLFQDTDGGTIMQDFVEYAVPGSFLEPVIHRLFIEKDLDRIFAFREKSVVAIFSDPQKI